MRVACTALALGGIVSVASSLASAQTPLTLADVLARAREQAPEIVSARLALEEVRGRMAGASQRRQANPEIDLAIGNRQGNDLRWTDLQIGASQAFDARGRRSTRIAAVAAQADQSTAGVEETTRAVLRDVATAFYEAVYESERIGLLSASTELADAIHQTADRRFRAGDLAVLDVNIARSALARVRAEREAARAALAAAIGRLKALVGLEGDVSVQGPLAAGADPDREALLQTPANRPELRALEAAIRDADLEVQLGRTYARPSYGVGLRYQREEGDHIVLGGLTVSLPVFSKGQEVTAVGGARARRLRAELEARTARVRIEVQTALEAYDGRASAARVLEREALPGLDENITLATRSFEAGQIGLPDLLLIQREILDTRFQYLAALLEAALARDDVDASAGVLR